MEIVLQQGIGNALLNAVRSEAYLCYPIIRPIGFKVGGDSTVVGIADSVVEDMTTFISNVSRWVFDYRGDSPVICTKVVCDGELLLSELLKGSGITTNGDAAILHSNAPVEVEVVFNFVAGNKLLQENDALLKKAGYNGFTAINSRHCVIDKFTFKVVDTMDDAEVFDVLITTVDGSSDKAVFKKALEGVIEKCRNAALKI